MSEAGVIRRLGGAEAGERLAALSALLIDCVEGGASVGFLAPLARERADAYWRDVVAGVETGRRLLLVAEDQAGGELVGTVQIVFAQPENQPHRADLSKLLVRHSARGRGLGAALVRAAEGAALAAGRTVLVLDTVRGSDAERLYARLGWVRVGPVPDYALMPDGTLSDTVFFYRALGAG